jgi:hypothetical protein
MLKAIGIDTCSVITMAETYLGASKVTNSLEGCSVESVRNVKDCGFRCNRIHSPCKVVPEVPMDPIGQLSVELERTGKVLTCVDR